MTTISGADIPKDYAIFYPGEDKSGRRAVVISLEKNGQSSKSRKSKNFNGDF